MVARHRLHHVEVPDKLTSFDWRQFGSVIEAAMAVIFLPVPRQVMYDVSRQQWWLFQFFLSLRLRVVGCA